MSHTFSFYCPGLDTSDRTIALDGEEHHHLARVLRMRAGQGVHVTNGRGLVVVAELDGVGERRTTARVVEVVRHDPEPCALVLALGLLPRATMETALAQCVEAGITGWIPVVAERGHVRRSGAHRDERWARIAVAAMKQSGRAWLPRIDAPVDVAGLIARFGAFTHVILADADARETPAVPESPALVIVGPEAGFSAAEEARMLAAGARPVRLSAQRLRAETAAVVAIAMLALGRAPV